ncbi:MAG TPA: hypothetical protein VEG65_06850 [Candidatus Bathyarchaeia archaeon]|nr:hypothetical protein [Candidatus Bathyarchaeia archaeon]
MRLDLTGMRKPASQRLIALFITTGGVVGPTIARILLAVYVSPIVI